MFYIINVGLKLKKKIYNMNGGKKMFKVTIGNSKLNTICQINLPAILSCREDAPCKKQCYVRICRIHSSGDFYREGKL